MPWRAFLFLGEMQIEVINEFKRYVEMPWRAFLFLGEKGMALTCRKELSRSKCPGGHFCFWEIEAAAADPEERHLVEMPWRAFLFLGVRGNMIVNANCLFVEMPWRAFLFLGVLFKKLLIGAKFIVSKCPGGHFCFWEEIATGGAITATLNVEMPWRAFLFLGGSALSGGVGIATVGRNALAGIFVFGSSTCGIRARATQRWSKCPGGHFCFWESFVAAADPALAEFVEMPWRAFLFLGATTPRPARTHTHGVEMPWRAFLFLGDILYTDTCQSCKGTVEMPWRAFLFLGG